MSFTYVPTGIQQTFYTLPNDGDAANVASINPSPNEKLANECKFLEIYARAAFGLRAQQGADASGSYNPASTPGGYSGGTPGVSTVYVNILTNNRTYQIDDTGCQDGDLFEVVNATSGGNGFIITVLSPFSVGLGTILPGGWVRFVRIGGTWTTLDAGNRNPLITLPLTGFIASNPFAVATTAQIFPINPGFPLITVSFTSGSNDVVWWPLGTLPRFGFITALNATFKGGSATPTAAPVIAIVRDNLDGTCTQIASQVDPSPSVAYHTLTMGFSETISSTKPYYAVFENETGGGNATIIGVSVRAQAN